MRIIALRFPFVKHILKKYSEFEEIFHDICIYA